MTASAWPSAPRLRAARLLLEPLRTGQSRGTSGNHITEEHVRQDTLTVVLPDMLADGTEPEAVEDHPYDELAELLAGHGVHVSADDLRGLPYDVELGPRLTNHFGPG